MCFLIKNALQQIAPNEVRLEHFATTGLTDIYLLSPNILLFLQTHSFERAIFL
jgi:hypothetical protein